MRLTNEAVALYFPAFSGSAANHIHDGRFFGLGLGTKAGNTPPPPYPGSIGASPTKPFKGAIVGWEKIYPGMNFPESCVAMARSSIFTHVMGRVWYARIPFRQYPGMKWVRVRYDRLTFPEYLGVVEYDISNLP